RGRYLGLVLFPAVHLGAELLRREQHETKVAPPLRDIEQHLAYVRLRSLARRVLVELVDEDDDGLDAEIAPLQVLAQLGDGAREHEILAERIDVRDVHHVHAAILEPAPRKVARRTGGSDEALAARGGVGEPIP